METDVDRARRFQLGTRLRFQEADALWQSLKQADQISWARQVLDRMHVDGALEGPFDAKRRAKLCQQRALLTSKDPERGVDVKHDEALQILRGVFDLECPDLDSDPETLGIAGGICKRKWESLGGRDDLLRALSFYTRAAKGALGGDAYPHINAAYLEDVLASLGDAPEERRQRATELRNKIVAELKVVSGDWFNFATRIEARVGLGRYQEAVEVAQSGIPMVEPWQRQTTVRQLAKLAHLRIDRPLADPSLRQLFDLLVPGAAGAIPSLVAGKLGLALSGGGFRASFFHLGVLARLAELDALRDVEVLSCVSGGSIVGACYWLALRRRMLDGKLKSRADYVDLVRGLITHFKAAVDRNLRQKVQSGAFKKLAARVLGGGSKGLFDSVRVADLLDRWFYRPLLPQGDPVFMRELVFSPPDHGQAAFSPVQDNWLREHKVPVLVINATTVNTGHCWQFTPTWMGESPWAVHPAADSVSRLEWCYYKDLSSGVTLGQAVAASACVPFLFEPIRMGELYGEGYDVSLVDGGVHDNQGTVALLAHNCDVLLVSDASGQLLGEPAPKTGAAGTVGYALRLQDVLMERIRWANFGDLRARRRSGQLKGFLFLHMKDGLDAPVIRPKDSQESYSTPHEVFSRTVGVRKDFQKAIAELRTDLDAFSDDEADALMACGYQMAARGWDREDRPLLDKIALPETWRFQTMLEEITSIEDTTPRRKELLQAFSSGAARRL